MKFVIGIDFGTESARLLLVDAANGEVKCSRSRRYEHGVIDEKLPGSGLRLEHDWALQHPADYLQVIQEELPALIQQAETAADDVIGLGIDFTACTVIPTRSDGTPLCLLPEWQAEPHAWVKLWKHHAAQSQADRVNALASERKEVWLERNGGKISPEWFLPKVLQVLEEAPQVYAAASRFIEAGDWLTWQLTGQEHRNAVAAGYRALWHPRHGYPSLDFFRALDPRLQKYVENDLSAPVIPNGQRTGRLTARSAQWTGLREGTPVAASTIDAHVTVHGAGATSAGDLTLVLGTSACHLLLSKADHPVPGICGFVEDGLLPGFYGYEAGQTAVGDHFEWFVHNALPAELNEQARAASTSVYALLEEQAARLQPGESGLLALDWWNGNRSILADGHLGGVLLGATLGTRPAEIYRALIEATAFGTRLIIENFEKHGVAIEKVTATGGLSERNPLLMQIFADVCGRTIWQCGSSQATALGAAVLAASAAGVCGSLAEATRRLTQPPRFGYHPQPEHQAVYNQLFAEYLRLHDYFGRGENNVLKKLRSLRSE